MFDLAQPAHFKRVTQASFDRTPAAYGTNGDFHWQFAARFVAHTPIVPSQTLLDVATGTAPAARLAAQKLGAHGSIIATDLSRGILHHAATNIRTDRIRKIALLCADGEDLPLGPAVVNGVMCSSAIVWLPQYRQALREWHRVLRDDGWLAFSCFGGQARQTLIGLLGQVLAPYGAVVPELNAPFNTRQKCHALLLNAGYQRITGTCGQDIPLPMGADTSFAWAWASHQRFNIQLTDEQQERIGYIGHQRRLWRTCAGRSYQLQRAREDNFPLAHK